jgi:GTPase
MTEREATEHLEELANLVTTYGIPIVGSEVVPLRDPGPAYLTGAGKAAEVHRACQALDADVIVVDDDLSPSQQRNWEKLTGLAVIDRREVILGIFADRAHTKEARLQVELARAEYSLPRLRRAWTHLERQRGGGGARGGAGELQLEVDRRLVQRQIDHLRKELTHVRRVRATQRKSRVEVPLPAAALVGYTNAGKSSLLNAMTGADVLEEDKLFATLDPTTRKVMLPNRQAVVMTDTVGFIRKLPHGLIEAFKATLEEAQLATMLLLVVDASHPNAMDQRVATEGVLEELGVLEKPVILVLNKIDLVQDRSLLVPLRAGYDRVVVTSTLTREGLDELAAEMAEIAGHDLLRVHLRIPPRHSDIIALVHRTGRLESESWDGDTAVLEAVVPRRLQHRLAPFMAGGVAAPENQEP